jgi:hypothetical protein
VTGDWQRIGYCGPATLLNEIEKTMARKILDTVRETARGLHEAGVMNTRTMREFDALCLQPVKTLSRTNKTTAHPNAGQPGSVRGLSEHQSFHGAEMGAGREEA